VPRGKTERQEGKAEPMRYPALAALLMLAFPAFAHAQYWGSPYRGGYYPRPYYDRGSSPYWSGPRYWRGPGWDDDDDPRYRSPQVQSGGERPIIPALTPRKISFPSSFPVNSIVIDTAGRQLFLVQSASEALYYPISVGREGFSWTGTESISRKAEWPDWYPPEEMRERDYRLPEKMTGGLRNPLGAMALYLGKTLYRIHGTNDAKSIGRAASSGCFRMLNGHIIDLALRVEVGTAVTVVKRLPADLQRIVAAQVGPTKSAAPEGERRS
jgi:lipoprotein-anchoring transpeptidase ErfK/SrfK